MIRFMTRTVYVQYLIMPLALFGAFSALCPASAEAKTPGKTICYNGICHRVLTIAETNARIGKRDVFSTSNYDDCRHDRFNPCGLTSSGAAFRVWDADNAASPIYPDGTIVLVRYPQTQKSAVLRIDNAGPYYGNRLLDVSRATAEKLGFAKRGIASLEVQVLQAPSKAEATYRKNRVYPSVPGYLGAFASLDGAAVRYASLTEQSTVAVASLYPQATARAVEVARPSLTGNSNGNGIETAWLAKAVTFNPALVEAKSNRKVAIRLARLEKRQHKARHNRVS